MIFSVYLIRALMNRNETIWIESVYIVWSCFLKLFHNAVNKFIRSTEKASAEIAHSAFTSII